MSRKPQGTRCALKLAIAFGWLVFWPISPVLSEESSSAARTESPHLLLISPLTDEAPGYLAKGNLWGGWYAVSPVSHGDDVITSNSGNCGEYNGSCSDGACDCHVPVCTPWYQVPHVAVWVDWLFLQANGADIAHAQQQNGLGGVGTVPFGDIGSLGIDYDSGVRLGGALCCDACSGVLVSWTWFQSDDSETLLPPAIPGVAAVGSLVHHPGAALLASVGPVDATYDVEFQLVDLMYKRAWLAGNRSYLSWLAGFQYGHLEQDLSQFGVFGGGAGGAIDTTTSIEFDGGGLKAGLEGERLVAGGSSLYGRMTGAAMSGRFRSSYTMLNTTGDLLLAEANWDDDRIVPQLEYELGVAWMTQGGGVRLSTGYMFSHWYNVVTTPEFISAVQADRYVDVGDTLSFDGLVVRLEGRW